MVIMSNRNPKEISFIKQVSAMVSVLEEMDNPFCDEENGICTNDQCSFSFGYSVPVSESFSEFFRYCFSFSFVHFSALISVSVLLQ